MWIREEFTDDRSKQFLAAGIPRSAKVADADLKWLKDISGIADLHLESNQIGDAGLKWLKDVPGLVALRLTSDRISDRGLDDLKHLKRLERLTIHN